MKRKNLIKYRYPGNGYYYVLCDVCGAKIRAREAVLISDKYNLHNQLLVCKRDVDKTNPQSYLKAFVDRQLENPRFVRSEGTDQFAFISDPSEIETGDLTDPAGRSPGAPRNLVILASPSTGIELLWMGPDDSGSGAIRGYKIERENPVGGGFATLTADTQSVATTYTDSTVAASTQYNYRVSAINKDGTGDPSNEAFATTGA